MEQLTYRFSLDTHKNGSQRTLQGFETGDTISRQLIISLTENEESYELPLDNVVAVMYVLRPSQSAPSINECTIEDNKIIYDITADDLMEEGIVKMQVKLISGTIEHPHRVIVSPRFDIEVWESLTQDSEAEDTQEYTALEDALIRAKMCYDGRIADYNIADDGTLTVVYGIVDDYNEDKTYAVNDKCYYGGKAWKCLQACTGETPEEGSYWTEISIDEAHITYTSDYLKNAIIAVSPTITVGTVTTGSPTSVTNSGTTTNAVFDFVLEKGEKGDDGADGADGQDGVSPVANVTKSGDTATITITDAIGTTTATISDGTDGTNGQDGFSPVANVSKTGNTATITITDAIGTTTAQISDGAGGDTVSWNQLQSTGTKIATVTINNTPTDVYAPTGGGGGGASSFAQLDDVSVSSPTTGQIPVFDSSLGQNGKWKNASVGLGSLSDVDTTGASNGEVLTKKSTGYEFDSIPAQAWSAITSKPFSSVGTNLSVDGSGVLSATDTTYSTVTKSADGLCPQLPNESATTKFLRQDGTWAQPQGGGHTIKNPSGTSMTQRDNLQFIGGTVSVTDDSANNTTKVTITGGGGGLLPHLIVITEEGSIVTAVKGTTTINFTETSVGHFEADLTDYGTWTIHSVLSGDDATTSIVIDACKIYTIDDAHFSASITAYYPQGGTCSCSMTGEQTLYANTCPYTFTVHKAGTWTISTTEYGETFTEDVEITTDGQSETVSLPDGSIITPTDDVPALLACAGIGDSQDATLSDLLADTTTLLAVLTTDNAIDYLVRSTTFASDITADEDAMAMIGSYDYASDTLLADSTWATAIGGSTYKDSVINVKNPKMTSNTTPSGVASGDYAYDSSHTYYNAFDENASTNWSAYSQQAPHWIGYEFPKAVKIVGAMINPLYDVGLRIKAFKIQGSNDGFVSDTHDLYSDAMPNDSTYQRENYYWFGNSTAYKYLRLYCSDQNPTNGWITIRELNFFGRENGGVQTWLRSGGITDKSYTTLAEVLADTTTLSALIANHDAVDYLVTAKAFIDGIVADVNAMSYIGLNNYCSNTLIADSDWRDAIANSTYIESVLNVKTPPMTSYNTPSGVVFANPSDPSYPPYYAFDKNTSTQWMPADVGATRIGYQFPSEKKICAFKLLRYNWSGYESHAFTNCSVQKSTDGGSTFVDVTTPETMYLIANTSGQYITRTFTPTTADRWAFALTSPSAVRARAIELQFYGREDV